MRFFIPSGYPFIVATDTVVGLCALPEDAVGLGRIYALKNRHASKPLALVATSPEQAAEHVEWTEEAEKYRAAHAPGSVTFVLKRKPASFSFAAELNPGLSTVGVRFPSRSPVIEILAALGRPLAATSVNISGRPSAATLAEARTIFPGVLVIGKDAASASRSPSSVVDFTGDFPKKLR
ncbi:MAG: L-threonylcarbamoyladenylate synthase [Rickettsiales bacterium]